MPQARAAAPRPSARLDSKLKAERIQEKLGTERIRQPLKAERIQERLADLPGWSANEPGTALTRTFDLPSLRATGLLVELVLATSETAGYVPEIDVRDRKVTVRVAASGGGAISDLDFEVAELLLSTRTSE